MNSTSSSFFTSFLSFAISARVRAARPRRIVAWSIDIHRFELINLPMEKYRSMLSWYRRIETSSGFQRMVLDYESQFKESMEAQRSEPIRPQRNT